MKRDAEIHIRVSSDLKDILQDLSKEYKITLSSLIFLILTDGISKNKISDKLKNKFKRLMIRIERKELCTNLYLPKNMYQRIMDVALSGFLVSGNVNMKSINSILDSFVAEFDSLDTLTQEKIGTDFKLLVRRLRNKEFLLSQSKHLKMIKYIGKK